MPTPSPDVDAELMLRVKRGGREANGAFQELVERWQQPVMNFVYRTLPDATEAEDLAQAVFVQLWKTAHRYQPSARFSTFLFTIARNLTLNEVRRRARHPADSIDVTHPEDESHPLRQFADPGAPGADLVATRTELHAKVEAALADLPEKQRTALLLCREGELSYDEIATVLGTSLQATKSLIHRAREVLKARLKPYLRAGTWSGD
ncbi:MAG TPA: sigma-70 family RNA polymerase sigma factor [Verrucomicrobiota bacterium]|nr:sigma-70 family RNA polymerase sigma factor [Verrucomicrobiota bacterium]